MPRSDMTKIGTTYGLSHPCSDEGPEQVYVFTTADEDRPVRIEGWVGYAVPMKMNLTIRQAKDLIPLLIEAVLAPSTPGIR